MDTKIKTRRLSAIQMLTLGFAAIILIGAVLLALPAATRAGDGLPFADALFTATSATCVTGLIVRDTYQTFSFFGQLVLIILIQIGGLGFMTLAVFWSIALRRRIGLRERSNLVEAVGALQIGGIVRLVRRVLIGTFLFEVLGACLLAIRFCPLLGLREGIWYAIFHAVSAFCNAGFDLMGRFGAFSSLVPFAGDPLVCLTVCGLIATGGLGFVVWNDIADNRFHFSKYRLHAKVMLVATGVLLLLSTAALLFLERDATGAGKPFGEQTLAALFQAVSARTAGMNTVDLKAMSNGSTVLMILLQFIGAGPGSTAGGVKLATFALLVLSTARYITKHDSVSVFRRTIPATLTVKAFYTAAFYLFVCLTGILLIAAAQPALDLLDIVYEAFSAIGTVGFTRSLTPSLNAFSRAVVMLLMFAGRIGSMSIVMAVSNKTVAKLKYPEENIIV